MNNHTGRKHINRREFLIKAGATTVLVGLAGCGPSDAESRGQHRRGAIERQRLNRGKWRCYGSSWADYADGDRCCG